MRLSYLLPTTIAILATSTQACLVYQATISYDDGYMAGTAIDNGLKTCTKYGIGTGQDPNQWTWSCNSGYSMHVYDGGNTAKYCNPDTCYTFSISCNYATNIIGCGASPFGC